MEINKMQEAFQTFCIPIEQHTNSVFRLQMSVSVSFWGFFFPESLKPNNVGGRKILDI